MIDAPANTMVLPTSEVVVAAHGGEATYNLLASAPTGDTNHVLCRGQDEPLSDFGRRVEWRLRALRRKSSIRKVSYLLGPHAPHDWLPSRQVLVTVLGLLSSGAEFELVVAPTTSVDVVQTLGELMPYVKVGVRLKIRRDPPIPAFGAPAYAPEGTFAQDGEFTADDREHSGRDAQDPDELALATPLSLLAKPPSHGSSDAQVSPPSSVWS